MNATAYCFQNVMESEPSIIARGLRRRKKMFGEADVAQRMAASSRL